MSEQRLKNLTGYTLSHLPVPDGFHYSKSLMGYSDVYKWFDYLKRQGHYIIAYVIMPNHLHVIIAFRDSDKSINLMMGNGKGSWHMI